MGVELFGWCSAGDTYQKGKGYVDQLKGPFFCGMNIKMNVDSFAMRLNSPSSTSKHIEVALKFSGNDGVVFTFDNPSNHGQYRLLRSFACSHISRFKEEDECLFFGGYYRIKVVTVRLIKTKENMKHFVSALFKFDKFLTGGGEYTTMSKKECFIIESLIHLALNEEQTKVTLPEYITYCFNAFRQNKKLLILDMWRLYGYGNERIQNFLFYSLVSRGWVMESKPNDDDLN